MKSSICLTAFDSRLYQLVRAPDTELGFQLAVHIKDQAEGQGRDDPVAGMGMEASQRVWQGRPVPQLF